MTLHYIKYSAFCCRGKTVQQRRQEGNRPEYGRGNLYDSSRISIFSGRIYGRPFKRLYNQWGNKSYGPK